MTDHRRRQLVLGVGAAFLSHLPWMKSWKQGRNNPMPIITSKTERRKIAESFVEGVRTDRVME